MAYGYNRLRSNARMVNRGTRGLLNDMDRFYLPSIEKASTAADQMGQLGSMRSSEDEFRDRMEGNINRFGGNALASDLDTSRRFGVDRFRQSLGANQAKFSALSNLAGLTLSGGIQGLSQRQQAQRMAADAKAAEDRANAQEREAERAATGQVVGDVIGTVADIALAPATGGTSLLNTVRRFAGGGSGSSAIPSGGQSLGSLNMDPRNDPRNYDQYGNYIGPRTS